MVFSMIRLILDIKFYFATLGAGIVASGDAGTSERRVSVLMGWNLEFFYIWLSWLREMLFVLCGGLLGVPGNEVWPGWRPPCCR